MPSPQLDEKQIFNVARTIDAAEERAQYLQHVCGGNSDLLGRIKDLLAGLEQQDSFLEQPAPGLTATMQQSQPVQEQPGTVIGPYKLLQVLGEGGMGVVYMAEQKEPVARRVALKIIKPGMDSGQVIARFEAERQALAMMDHPNIAKVLDAGATDAGRPYFVMELVKGIPISDYCDEQHFTPQERLELFAKVCQAVQHAHQKGVIHRDLKPSNVLVAEYDHQAVPKIIDFGVAKATSQKLTEKTMFTQYGQIVGTLEYMSPEQAKLNQLDIDTRSDVYSLGVLLYRLLTGTTPFESERLQSAAFEEMLRIIREEEPPKPSTRISTVGKSAVKLSASRRTTPQSLHQFVKGELDWIVMRALEKDRSRRYESASSLASDIKRFLGGEAVLACPPSRGYLLRKFVWRHHKTVAAGVALFAALSLGLMGTSLGYFQARRAELAATEARDAAQKSENEAVRLAASNESLATKERVARQAAEHAAESLRQRLYISSNKIAHQAWKNGNVDLARQTLQDQIPNSGQEDLRKFEWHHLWREIQETPVAQELIGGELLSVTSGPNPLVAVANGTQLNMWPLADTSRGGPSVAEELGFVTNWPEVAICVSRDGRLVAYVRKSPDSSRHDLVLRRLSDKEVLSETPIEVTVFGQGTDRQLKCGDMAFSPNGRFLAIALKTEGILLWSVAPDNSVRFERGYWGHKPKEWITEVEFDGESEVFASACHDGAIKVWDIASHNCLATLTHDSPVQTVAFLSGKRVVAGSRDRAVRIWSPNDETLQSYSISKSFEEEASIGSIAVSPDEGLMSVARSDSMVHIRDLETGRTVRELRGLRGALCSVVFAPDGKVVAAQSSAGGIKTWPVTFTPNVTNDTGDPRPKASSRVLAHGDPINRIAMHPRGDYAATASSDRTVKIWNTKTGERLKTLEPGYGIAVLAHFSADGETLVTSSWDGEVKPLGRWQDDRNEPPTVFTGGGYFDTEGRYFCRMEGGVLGVRAWPSQRRVRQIAEVNKITPYWRSHTFVPQSAVVAIGGKDGALGLWNVENGEEVWTKTAEEGHSKTVWSIAASNDGSRVVSCGADWNLKVWDSTDGKLLRTLSGHTNTVRDAVFSPDDRTLASCSADGSVILWDTETWEQRFTLHGDHSFFNCVGFNCDGNTLIAGGRDGYLWFWRM